MLGSPIDHTSIIKPKASEKRKTKAVTTPCVQWHNRGTPLRKIYRDYNGLKLMCSISNYDLKAWLKKPDQTKSQQLLT